MKVYSYRRLLWGAALGVLAMILTSRGIGIGASLAIAYAFVAFAAFPVADNTRKLSPLLCAYISLVCASLIIVFVAAGLCVTIVCAFIAAWTARASDAIALAGCVYWSLAALGAVAGGMSFGEGWVEDTNAFNALPTRKENSLAGVVPRLDT